MRRTRILVVEDDPDVRDLVVELLETEGYDVQTASNRREALNVAAQRACDLILTGRRCSPGLVIERTLAKDSAALLAQPAGLVLPKPFTPAELCQVLRRALATSAPRPCSAA